MHGSRSADARRSWTASLGSHTAAMLAPFTDAPGRHGSCSSPRPKASMPARRGADKAGLQVMVHAIGDRAIRLQLESSSAWRRKTARAIAASGSSTPSTSHPPTSRASRPWMSLPACSPTTRSTTAAGRNGSSAPERARTTYAFRALLDAHARLAFGSDWDVAPATPIEGHLRRGHPPHTRWRPPRWLVPGTKDHGRGGPEGLHQRCRICRVSGAREGNCWRRQTGRFRPPGPRPHPHAPQPSSATHES